jgi:methylenetetrahydrofolate dehydrogenase (NADP+)/methenyltetrahydrofolate cyclohydrolase
MSQLIDGRIASQAIKKRVRADVDSILAAGGRAPKLAVILVGNHPPSEVYVRNKEAACRSVGIETVLCRLPKDAPQKRLIDLIHDLNSEDSVDGILPQLPLPPQMSRTAAILAVDPQKDVDGLTPLNQGLLDWNLPGIRPCTPSGIVELVKFSGTPIKGALAAVLGRSLLVGAPAANLLSHEGATTISMHSESRETKDLTRQADIVVVATGVHHLVDGSWIKPGATVIDVGIHRMPDGSIEGDVDFRSAAQVAGKITPVPGGVGPMTIASLLVNCVSAYRLRKG